MMMLAFVTLRTIKMATAKADPMFASTILVEEGSMDLWQLGFMFAIEQVPASVGQIQAYHVTWPSGGSEKVKTPI